MTNEKEKQDKVSLEDEVRYSRRAVLKGWMRNMKDGVDPVITGAKMGFFGLHAIPTWYRQHGEGKMTTDSPWFTGVSAVGAAAGSLGVYFLASQKINQDTQSEWQGYLVAAGMPAAQGVSWAYEALLRAKKSEMSKVVMTKLQRSFDVESEGYDLTSKAIVDGIAKDIYEKLEKRTRDELGQLESRFEDADEQWYNEEIGKLKEDLADNKGKGDRLARRSVLYAISPVFNGLVADGQLGKQYEMSPSLTVGPEKRQREGDNALWNVDEDDELARTLPREEVSRTICEKVIEAVKAGNGKANIELFGTVTVIYTNDGKDMNYQVTPNDIWKV